MEDNLINRKTNKYNRENEIVGENMFNIQIGQREEKLINHKQL